MTNYRAVMIDETGCEFGVDLVADSRDEAYAALDVNYPESRVDTLEDPSDAARREKALYDSIRREIDGDDDGDWYDEDYDEEDEE